MANIFPPEEADWGSKEAKVARFLNEYLDDDFFLFLNFKYLDNVKGVSREGDVLVLCNEGFLVIEIICSNRMFSISSKNHLRRYTIMDR